MSLSCGVAGHKAGAYSCDLLLALNNWECRVGSDAVFLFKTLPPVGMLLFAGVGSSGCH